MLTMGEALKLEGVVGKNGEVVVHVDTQRFPEGTRISFVANPVTGENQPKKSLMDFWGTGKGLFASPEEVVAFIRRERDLTEERLHEVAALQESLGELAP